LKQYKKALADLNKSLELDPNFTYALGERAMANQVLGFTEQGLADVNAYLKVHPDDMRVYRTKGRLLNNSGRYKEAIAVSTDIIDNLPDSADDYRDRAIAYINIKECRQAIKDATKAIELNSDPESFAIRSWAYEGLKQYDKALADADTAINLQPNHRLALTLKAMILNDTGKPEEGLKVANKAVETNPDYRQAYKIRAAIYKRLGKKELAEADRIKGDGLSSVSTYNIEDQ
jgi:tetratricopeptide (TPR) repeat protein